MKIKTENIKYIDSKYYKTVIISQWYQINLIIIKYYHFINIIN